MKRFLLIIPFILNLSFAKSSIHKVSIQKQMYELCEEINSLTIDRYGNHSFEPVVPLRFFTDTLNQVYTRLNFSDTQEYKILFNEYPALLEETFKECWPNKPVFRNMARMTLKLASQEGKLMGIVRHYGMFKGMTWVFSRIALKSRKLAAGLGLAFASLFGYSIYSINDSHKEEVEILTGKDLTPQESGVVLSENLENMLNNNFGALDKLLSEKSVEKITLLQEKLNSCINDCDKYERAILVLTDFQSTTK